MTLDRKFWDDTVWNYGSFAVVAASGLCINFIIAAQMGSEALGVFNQTYAVYVIAAQVASMAVHDSAQKHVSEHRQDEEKCRVLSAAAILHSLVTGGLIAGLIFMVHPLMGRFLDSQATATGIAYAAPGLAFFAVNKTFLGILNGQRKMRLYAIGQAIRAFGILAVSLLVALTGKEAAVLGLCFTLTEIVLLPYLIIVALPKKVSWRFEGDLKDWTKLHFSFGSRAFVNGFLAEAYVRVDILMLGLFLSDEKVGVYSFAAMFIEGLFQVAVVVRTISNPVFVGLLSPLDKKGFSRFARRVAGVSFLMSATVATVLLLVFPYFNIVFDPVMIEQGYPILVVLAFGVMFFSFFIPCDHVLLQAGHPGGQSLMMSLNIMLNVVLNFFFIPQYGLMGAAFATACAFVGSGVVLNLAVWRALGLRGGLFFSKE